MYSIDLPNINSVQAVRDVCSGIVVDMEDDFSIFTTLPSKYYFVKGRSGLKPKNNYSPGIRRSINENRPIIL